MTTQLPQLPQLSLLLGGLLLLAAVQLLNSRRFKGWIGERRVRRALQTDLPPEGYSAFHDLTLPARSGTTQIDHLVISTHGIIIVETKNMKGQIKGRAEDRDWVQRLGFKSYRFQNPLRQNFKHAKAVAELLGVDEAHLHGVVVFVGRARPGNAMPLNVLWSSAALPRFLSCYREPVFEAGQCIAFSERLTAQQAGAGRPGRRAHVKHVKEITGQRGAELARCPKCDAAMVKRVSRKTGEAFLGCTEFPKCRGTRRIA